jgi:hypothetical protein
MAVYASSSSSYPVEATPIPERIAAGATRIQGGQALRWAFACRRPGVSGQEFIERLTRQSVVKWCIMQVESMATDTAMAAVSSSYADPYFRGVVAFKKPQYQYYVWQKVLGSRATLLSLRPLRKDHPRDFGLAERHRLEGPWVYGAVDPRDATTSHGDDNGDGEYVNDDGYLRRSYTSWQEVKQGQRKSKRKKKKRVYGTPLSPLTSEDEGDDGDESWREEEGAATSGESHEQPSKPAIVYTPGPYSRSAWLKFDRLVRASRAELVRLQSASNPTIILLTGPSSCGKTQCAISIVRRAGLTYYVRPPAPSNRFWGYEGEDACILDGVGLPDDPMGLSHSLLLDIVMGKQPAVHATQGLAQFTSRVVVLCAMRPVAQWYHGSGSFQCQIEPRIACWTDFAGSKWVNRTADLVRPQATRRVPAATPPPALLREEENSDPKRDKSANTTHPLTMYIL